MLNKAKLDHMDIASMVKHNIHLIGCGSVGSHLAELFAREGVANIDLWDFDIVSAHNLTNQMFNQEDIGKTKVDAVEAMMLRINPEIAVSKHVLGLEEPYILTGYIFMCVDSIELRNKIVAANAMNPTVQAFFDFRTRLTDAQAYAAVRTDPKQMKALKSSMAFTHEEVTEVTPVSACGVELNVVDVIKTITSFGFANFRNYMLGEPLKITLLVDMKQLTLDAY